MSKLSRMIMAAAGVVLGGMYLFPLWTIGLIAPQYPEGLGMLVGMGTLSGRNPQDLNNINELNHYIGMRVIDPAAIPELRFMPWIVAALILFAMLVAVRGRRLLIVGWLASVAAFGVAGLADFWRWTYEYGHNLDLDHAIIKMPGTVYQPPLLGSKQILNFTATSWPAAGAWLAAAAFAMGAIALILSRRGMPVRATAPVVRIDIRNGVADVAHAHG